MTTRVKAAAEPPATRVSSEVIDCRTTLVCCVNILRKEDNPCLLVLLTLEDSRAFPHTFICMFLPMKSNKILISLKEGGKEEALDCSSDGMSG